MMDELFYIFFWHNFSQLKKLVQRKIKNEYSYDKNIIYFSVARIKPCEKIKN